MTKSFDEIRYELCRHGDERSVLHFCIKNIDLMYVVLSKLNEFDFLNDEHQTLFIMIKSIEQRNSGKVDFTLLINTIQNNCMETAVGGLDYVKSIAGMIISEDNFNVYLSNVIDSSTKFKLYKKLNNSLSAITENSKADTNASDIVGGVINDVMGIYNSHINDRDEPVNLSDGLEDYIKLRKDNRITMSGLSLGYVILNKRIDGLVPGTLTVIVARKKMGKSAILSNIADHVAYIDNRPVLYLDTEMPFEQWRDRMLSIRSGIPERIIKHGGYSDDIYRRLMKAAEIIYSGKLYHEFVPGYNVDRVSAMYKKYKMKDNIELGIFDYIKEPKDEGGGFNRKEYQKLGDVTTKMKDLAGELDIPFLAAAQLSREGDVADSDRIARYADVIIEWTMMDKEELEQGGEKMTKGTHKLIIRDSRRGGTTSKTGIGYWFFKDKLKIKEVPVNDQLIDYSSFGDDYGSA